ncbi:DUF2533 family protein [Priestia taiwanensis]|uniref:DUF2533 family protein n=1 Tax=Priestia taiwanensis TaxID=1347902 RepID=A0A917EL95_9BACI|nr:DUF2533 family protein [Priestia taiwanensis]MBM7361757.1 hypothetical protein [Priestia taiwanensis]GGE56745.1 hypothetical protein GCM10007140_03840 [Priestia taiwanensis]
MSNVHEAISKHSQAQHQIVKRFVELEYRREDAIEAAVAKCKNGEEFSIGNINVITEEMNELARTTGIVPVRKYVTPEMVQEYVTRLQ